MWKSLYCRQEWNCNSASNCGLTIAQAQHGLGRGCWALNKLWKSWTSKARWLRKSSSCRRLRWLLSIVQSSMYTQTHFSDHFAFIFEGFPGHFELFECAHWNSVFWLNAAGNVSMLHCTVTVRHLLERLVLYTGVEWWCLVAQGGRRRHMLSSSATFCQLRRWNGYVWSQSTFSALPSFDIQLAG